MVNPSVNTNIWAKRAAIAHVDAVMGVLRRTIVTELQSSLVSLKSCVIDIAYDEEHKSR